MIISHVIDDGVLHVKILRDLDITNRAAAALQIEALVSAHRPASVTVELPAGPPSPATLSALARAQRMCQSMSVPLTATSPGSSEAYLEGIGAGNPGSRRLHFGARQDH
ncbi:MULTISPECIES: hypothetical protein [Streptomyces]|uniref:Uncharacterized protein n=1 Tax=Streptomyces solicathayae TaxID=3081768 RepID=A0ABZ0M2G6_9ACTN|nr:hypothetical protein [Streptomyces sp. HUAS YS2]WOX25894.1 hypothetical protein R2D22_32740 [Streptomyces sp. HUAS YS2]